MTSAGVTPQAVGGYNVPNLSADFKLQDLDRLARTVEAWMRAQLPGVAEPRLSALQRPRGAGSSNETILFHAEWREHGQRVARDLVLRIHPSRYQLFKDTDFALQFRLLQTLGDRRLVKVADMHWYEADTAWLGQPFFVMSRLPGRVPVSNPPYNVAGWLTEARPSERARLWHSAVEELCRIHGVAPEVSALLDKPHLGSTGFEQHLEYWSQSLDWASGGRDCPVLNDSLDWLRGHLPAGRVDGLSWGDARIGNMMFDERFEVRGVMDWEQASRGGAMLDLGWWLFFDVLHSTSIGVSRLEGLGSRADTLSIWESSLGRRATDLPWYEIHAGFKLGVIIARKLSLEKNARPGFNSNNNLFTRLLAEKRGIAAPLDTPY